MPVTVTISSGSLNWLALVVPIIVSLLGVAASIIAARRVAHGALQSGRQQAIETEVLKLRHDVARRRLGIFDEMARAIRQELGYDKVDETVEYVKGWRFVRLNLECPQAAVAAALPADRADIQRLASALSDAGSGLSRCADRMPGEEKMTPEQRQDFADCLVRFLLTLDDVQNAVDWAAEKRILSAMGGALGSSLEEHLLLLRQPQAEQPLQEVGADAG